MTVITISGKIQNGLIDGILMTLYSVVAPWPDYCHQHQIKVRFHTPFTMQYLSILDYQNNV